MSREFPRAREVGGFWEWFLGLLFWGSLVVVGVSFELFWLVLVASFWFASGVVGCVVVAIGEYRRGGGSS